MLKRQFPHKPLDRIRAGKRGEMKPTALALLLMLGLITCSASTPVFQGARGEKTPQGARGAKPAPTPKPAPAPGTEPRRSSAASKPSSAAEVTIKTTPAICAVMLDGKSRGSTSRDGLLNLANLTPGSHIVIVNKTGYQKEERQIEVVARQSQIVEIALTPLPVALSVSANVAGAKILVANQSFDNAVEGLMLMPGTYQIKVSKAGYKSVLREIELQPAKPEKIEATLEPVPVETLLAQAEQALGNRRYDQASAAALDVLAAQPNQPRANYLLGQSYFNRENYAESVPYLVKAIQLGEQVILPVKHHHVAGRTLTLQTSDDFCAGQFILRKGVFEFQATGNNHSFSISPAKIYELNLDSHKDTPRLRTRVGILKNNKEDKQNFNFFADRAALRKRDPNNANSINDVYCQHCQAETDALYQILLQIRK